MNHDCSRIRRAAALAVVALLVFAQSVSAAHFHQKDFRTEFAQTVPAADAPCGLCLFHFHSPTNPGAGSAAAAAIFIENLVAEPASAPLTAPAISQLFPRAPPAAA